MNEWIAAVERRLANDSDWFRERETLGGEPVQVLGFHTLIDLPATMSAMRQYAEGARDVSLLGEVVPAEDEDGTVQALLGGKLLVFFERTGEARIANPIAQPLARPIGTPNNDNVVRGPVASFTEGVYANVGLTRQYLKSDKLKIAYGSSGRASKTDYAILYLEGSADLAFVRKLQSRLEENRATDLSTLQQVVKAMGLSIWSAVSRFNTTELPMEAGGALVRGRTVLFVDNMPFALVLPVLLWDLFSLEGDNNLPRFVMLALRFLRVLGALTTIVLPALYVALVAVNPEALRIQLALSVAQSREGVPYPAVFETLIMLFILELILEGSIRLPKSVGPTITMVGGIVLGQAVVSAKLVSNLLIIVLAVTTIANSAIAGFQNSYTIRLVKYITLILAAIFGVLGIYVGFVVICTYLASQHTFGVSYVRMRFEKSRARHG